VDYVDWKIYMFFHILGRKNPTDELIFFRGVETTSQMGLGSLLYGI